MSKPPADPERVTEGVELVRGGVSILDAMSRAHVGYGSLKKGMEEAGVESQSRGGGRPKKGDEPRRPENAMSPLNPALLCACGASRRVGETACKACRELKFSTCSCKRSVPGEKYQGVEFCRVCRRSVVRRRA